MSEARFIGPTGQEKTGRLVDDTLVTSSYTYPLNEVILLPPSDPSKIVCVGLNYHNHIEEGSYDDIPDIPMLFLKPPNTLAGHGSEITLDFGDKLYEHEAELGVIIGEQCRNLTADEAMDYVSGFTCGNDVSNRDDQYMEKDRGWNFFRGKAFDGSAPLGPVSIPPENVADDATIELSVNGERRQQSTLDDMLFSIPEIIEEVTTYMTLEPGDVLLTGTPAGVGSLTDGDVAEVTIDDIGTLRNTFRIPSTEV